MHVNQHISLLQTPCRCYSAQALHPFCSGSGANYHVCLQAIEAFQKDPPTTVFLLSMRSGSVGINLTSANYVFILEPALNPALEEQAIGRAWRMGQQREVIIKKFYVKVSISCSQIASNVKMLGAKLRSQ